MGVFNNMFNHSGGNSEEPLQPGDSIRRISDNSRGKIESVRDTEMGWRITVEWTSGPKEGEKEEVSPKELVGTHNF